MARYLLTVAREKPALFDYLRQAFAGEKEVQIVFDRRRGQRRQRAPASESGRRRADRRSPPTTEENLRAYGFSVFRRE